MRSSRYQLIYIAFLGCLAWSGIARAQSAEHLGLGGGVNFYRPTDRPEAQPSEGVGLVYRWHTFHSGWGPTFTVDFHKTSFVDPLGDVTAPLGSMRMNAVLIGFGHTQNFGRVSASGSVTGGYTFNHLTAASDANAGFQRAGLTLVGLRARNSPAAKSEVSVWYDVAKRLGVNVSTAYFLARPDVVINTTTGSSARRLRADALELQVGLAVGVWKKHR